MKLIKGLQGVVAAESDICKIGGKKGTLVYRGYAIEDLAKYSSFEEVVFLLWEGRLPKRAELTAFKRSIAKHMKLPLPIKKAIQSTPKRNSPMATLRTAVSMLSAYDEDAEDLSPAATRRKAVRILAAMPCLVAAIKRTRQGKRIVSAKKGLSFAGNFLYMMNGKKPSKEEERTVNVALILHAEHGMNASTFTSRVVVSTLSDIHSAITAAICSLKGPLHGGANKKAIQAFQGLGEKLHLKDVCDISCRHEVDKYVLKLLKEKKRIMGIGHRVYKVKDPRAKILEEFAKKVGQRDLRYYEMAKEIELIMIREKGLYPNVDFFSGIVYDDLNIPPELYVCIFALSRTAGWIAHVFEQYGDNRLIRPTTIYTGKIKRKYRKIGSR